MSQCSRGVSPSLSLMASAPAPAQPAGNRPEQLGWFRDLRQVGRTLTAADEGVLGGRRVLIGDRDATWSAPVRARRIRRLGSTTGH